jgi:hypothetical protein
MDKNWIAGFVNADGSLGVYVKSKADTVLIRFSISQHGFDKALLERCQVQLGANITKAYQECLGNITKAYQECFELRGGPNRRFK